MLEIRNLCFDLQDKCLLKQVSLRIVPGQLLYLHGNNGAGKTTLLRLVAGLLRPHAGDIFYEGQSIYSYLSTYQQKICYVGHKLGINPLLTLRENCFFELHWGRREFNFEQLLANFGLASLAEEPCARLSMGERRRVSLLRLAMSDAKIWLLDEPFVALDKQAISLLLDSLETHLFQGGKVILTSHQHFPLRKINCREYRL